MRCAAVIPVAALLLAAPLLATPARAGEIVCRPDYDYSVEVDGSYPHGACFYKGDVHGKWFIDIPENKSGLMLDLTAKKIFAVPRDRVGTVANGSLTVKDDLPPGGTAYAFAIEGPTIQFQADGKQVRILPCLQRPPIDGPTTIAALEDDRPEYREGIRAYKPDAASMDILSKYGKPVEIEAFFATWCPHCKVYMPKFLRAIKDANNPRIKLNLVGCPKGFGSQAGPWQGKNVTSVPTIIVRVDGREITRMGAHEGAVPEEELAGILKAVH